MNQTEIQTILDKQREYFQTGATLPLGFRREALKKLLSSLTLKEDKLLAALKADLGKSANEGYMCELALTKSEIRYMLSHLRRYMREKRVHTPLAQTLSRSFVKPVPYGQVLVMSPWNYPLLLSLEPLVDAIAAGNTVIVKPSAYSPASSEIIKEIIEEIYAPEFVYVVTGGRAENTALLEMNFDYIFFTGSKNVGKQVMANAAKHLTPVTLELGGKSPCIVDSTANLSLAAKRIVFGKFVNCGQTCVAPDYIYCDAGIKDKLIEELKKQITKQYSSTPLTNEAYGKMINEKHFNRVCSLIDANKVVIGGKSDASKLKIEPTVMNNVTFDDKVMGEEIFGPVLPVLTYNSLEDAAKVINEGDSPLALYMFSSNKKNIEFVKSRIQYGGGCINDTLIHLATSEMGFGGVKESGMGSYHGRCGFDTFSHKKSIVDKKTIIDLPMRYQPYTKFYDTLIRWFVR